MTKLVALVGINIGDKRFEAGERIDAEVTQRQERWLVGDGLAERVEDNQRLPPEHKEAIEEGAGTPNPIEASADTQEGS